MMTHRLSLFQLGEVDLSLQSHFLLLQRCFPVDSWQTTPIPDPGTQPELFWSFFPLLLLLQATGAPRPGAAIAAWPTVPTSTCSEGTIPTTMSPEGRRTRTTPSSGSSGGTTLPQTPGIRWAPKATCPGNWPPCHVRMEIQLLACLFLELF